MRELIDKLNYYTYLYDIGKPKITDKEWDDLYFELEKMEKESGVVYPDSPTQAINYQVVNNLKKVEHNHKMLSLAKTKDLHEISVMFDKTDFLVMGKLDGLTCSLRYLNGELVSAETRGNSLIGEDITHNAQVIPSIPKTIPYKDELVVDGEVVCLKENFKFFSREYKNPRNFAAGSIRLLDAKECAKRRLSFVAWDMITGYPEEDIFSKRLELLKSLGFLVVPWIKDHVIYAANTIKDYCLAQGYPIDGIVFKFESVSYGKSLGETIHHARNAIAYKFYDEIYKSTLMDIKWSMGRTGVLTPIAIFEPVDIDGSTVSRANLHNLSVMEELLGPNPHKGQPIMVEKSNMIIPQVVSAEKTEPQGVLYYKQFPVIEIPTVCPICGKPVINKVSDTNSVDLFCPNPSCGGKLINQIEHFFGKKGLEAKGLSKATFDKLISWGWVKSIKDVYFLTNHADEWKQLSGFGEKSVNKILTAIESTKDTTLEKFIGAVGIPLVGTAMARTLAEHFETWEDFRDATKNNFDFTKLEDFGIITDEAIKKFNFTQADEIRKLLTITNPKKITIPGGKLDGKRVVITGKLEHFHNREALQRLIEQNGGIVLSSVTKNVDILVNNDYMSTSTKNVTAKKLRIPILSEDEFLTDYID